MVVVVVGGGGGWWWWVVVMFRSVYTTYAVQSHLPSAVSTSAQLTGISPPTTKSWASKSLIPPCCTQTPEGCVWLRSGGGGGGGGPTGADLHYKQVQSCQQEEVRSVSVNRSCVCVRRRRHAIARAWHLRTTLAACIALHRRMVQQQQFCLTCDSGRFNKLKIDIDRAHAAGGSHSPCLKMWAWLQLSS
jgi:hypothetical protein